MAYFDDCNEISGNFMTSRKCDFMCQNKKSNCMAISHVNKPANLPNNLSIKSHKESCSMSDCMPKIERLIRTFKEAQSLVDAVGNVPAIVGLKPIVPIRKENSYVRYNGGGEIGMSKTQISSKGVKTSIEKSKKQDDDSKSKANEVSISEDVVKLNNEEKTTTKVTSNKKQKKQLKANYPSNSAEVDNPYNVAISKDVMIRAEELARYNTSLIYGHRKCTLIQIRVPCNMGWLWNSSGPKHCKGKTVARLGWRPGAIGKYVYKLLKAAKAKKTSGPESTDPDALPMQKVKSKIRGKGTRMTSSSGARGAAKDEDKVKRLPPTLHVHRKDGTYYITMYPVTTETEACKSPETVEPLRFKVTKNENDVSIASSTTASDMELEFSPPAAIIECRKRAEIKDEVTQVEQKEIIAEVSGKATSAGEKGNAKKSKKAPK